MQPKTVSLVVPVFNMAGYLEILWSSLDRAGLLRLLHEVVLVNDGSTDRTKAAIEDLSRRHSLVRLVQLNTNKGRFVARVEGAKAARSSHVLFLDARTALRPGFGTAMAELLQSHECLMGVPFIDEKQSVYSLYWKRTHERLFHRHFRDARKGFALTSENYEDYAKGTTVFLCPRQIFLEICERFKDRPLLSDDTFLMREMVKIHPIWVQDSLAIDWEPRQDFRSFVTRLWERGPQFVEYHVLERQGLYFAFFVLWALTVIAVLGLLVLKPIVGAVVATLGLTTLALSTALFAKSVGEFFRMIPVHVSTILVYGFGAIYGLGVNWGWFGMPKPTGAEASAKAPMSSRHG